MNTVAKFNRDLAYGKRIEKRVLERFCKPCDKSSYMIEGKEKCFDIVMPSLLPFGEIKIEVKCDKRATQVIKGKPATGNIVIEKSSRNKPSGIETTTADFWVHWTGEKLYAIKVSELKEFLKLFKAETTGGDDNTSLMYKIPIEQFETQATTLIDITNEKGSN